MVGAWHEYLARCQAVLQRGQPVADICYLAPEGAPHVFRPPASALAGAGPVPDRKGYNFDGCAPETLLAGATVKRSQLVLPGGAAYRVLVLPEMETMTPSLLRKVRDLVKAGATVIGSRPLKSPSLSDYPVCDQEVQRLAAELWGPGSPDGDHAAERKVGKGRVIIDRTMRAQPYSELYLPYDSVADVLARMGVPPDFESDVSLRYTHRREGKTDLYFVANPAEQRAMARCSFRVAGRPPEIWDPMTGAMHAAGGFEEKNGRTIVNLSLEPGGSVFVVFGKSMRDRDTDTPLGARQREEATLVKTEIRGPWEVRFQPGRGAPEKIVMEQLADWSEHPDPGVKYFSGQATYRTTFSLDPKLDAGNSKLTLDLGQVFVYAQVKINGRDVGILWRRPFRMEITHAVKPGENTLEITVANLWPNRLIGDKTLPAGERIAWTTWNPFTKDGPLLQSGLLGPVYCEIVTIGDAGP
jgi:hypothetical protein